MKYTIALFAILLLASCEKDIIVDVPPQTTKLVVYGISSTNTPFRVYISKTAGILQNTTPDSYQVTNAFVQLYENNVLKDTLVYDASTRNYAVKRNTRAVAGNTYLLKASAPNITEVEAETVTPKAITIQSITRRANARTDANGQQLDELKITFTDDAATANYYVVKIQAPHYNGGGNMAYGPIYCMHSSDKDIERRNNADPTDFENCIDGEFFMTDKNFNGRTKELLLFVQHYNLDPVINPMNNRLYRPVVELNSVTAHHYKYRKSFDAYTDSEDNPFSEPVLVYTNVKNGYGVFSTYSMVKDTIR
jgi:hypothetical protein